MSKRAARVSIREFSANHLIKMDCKIEFDHSMIVGK
jgi:hypothetical protein